MKIAPYIEKLNNSQEFRDFQQKYKDSFMVAGFFVLDLEAGQNVHQLDFYVPSKKKIAAFSLDKKISLQLLDIMHSAKEPEKLDIKTNLDLNQLPGILEEEMKNRSITDEIKKIIAIIQSIDGKKIWNLNCVLSGMSILNAHIDDESKTVLKMERKSLMDIMQRIPAQPMAQLQPEKLSEKDIDLQIKKLDKLEKAIEKEKQELVKVSKKQKSPEKDAEKENKKTKK